MCLTIGPAFSCLLWWVLYNVINCFTCNGRNGVDTIILLCHAHSLISLRAICKLPLMAWRMRISPRWTIPHLKLILEGFRRDIDHSLVVILIFDVKLIYLRSQRGDFVLTHFHNRGSVILKAALTFYKHHFRHLCNDNSTIWVSIKLVRESMLIKGLASA